MGMLDPEEAARTTRRSRQLALVTAGLVALTVSGACMFLALLSLMAESGHPGNPTAAAAYGAVSLLTGVSALVLLIRLART